MMRVTERLFDTAIRALEPTGERLINITEGVRAQTSRWRGPSASPTENQSSENEVSNDVPSEILEEMFSGRFERLLECFDICVSETLAKNGQTLWRLHENVGAETDQWLASLEDIARKLIDGNPDDPSHIAEAGQTSEVATNANNDAEARQTEIDRVSSTLGAAIGTSRLPSSLRGEAERIILLTPNDDRDDDLASRIKELAECTPTIYEHDSLHAQIIREAIGVRLQDVARWLERGIERRIELADRLATRVDIY